MAADLAARLRAALARPAAGTSDFDLSPGSPPESAARPAAVLIAVDPQGGVVMTKRASHLRNHPGQIAFPGGRQDAADADLAATALREAQEEIGLCPGAVTLLGTLAPHRTVTGFAVTAHVGLLHAGYALRADPAEVAEIFRVPLAHVTTCAHFRVERRIWRGRWRYYDVVPWGPYYIWGASARMLRGLAERMAQCA